MKKEINMENTLNKILHYIEDNSHTLLSNNKVGKKPISISYNRFYLIFVLITQHNYTPTKISNLFKVHRKSYYDVLEKVPYLLNDKVFLDYIKTVLELFPHNEENVKTAYSLLAKIKSEGRGKGKIEEIGRTKKLVENVFSLSLADIEKLRKKPSVVNIIKNIIKTL